MHACPECGLRCHCGGDIDDIPFEVNDFCSCCFERHGGRKASRSRR